MKIIKYIFFCCCLTAGMVACTSDKTTEGTSQNAHDAHDHADHAGHDHSGHDHADHAGHDHSGHNHAGHDHSGHDHSGHDHAGHDHGASNTKQVQRKGPTEAELAVMKAKREEAKTAPLTAAEKKVGGEICSCMNKYPIFKKLAKAKDQASFDKAAGDKLKDVKALQDCHNTIMPDAVKALGDTAGIFAHKARRHMNETCLNGNNDIWMMIGKYIISQNAKSNDAINEKRNKVKNLSNGQ